MELELIPRRALFGNPDRELVQISPDGSKLAWLASREGVLNVWVAGRDDPANARPVTADTVRGIRFYQWAYTGKHILYIQDKGGDENWRIYAVQVNTGETRELTPFEDVQANIVKTSPGHPSVILVALNRRDPEWHDLFRLDLNTGQLALVLENDRFSGFIVTEDYEPVIALETLPDGGMAINRPSPDGWQVWETIPKEDGMGTEFVGLDKAAAYVYLNDSRGRDTSALFIKDLSTGEQVLLAEDPRCDAGEVITHPTGKHVQAVSFTYDRKRWQVIDPGFAADLDYLATLTGGEVNIGSRSLDDRWWIVTLELDNSPRQFYLYDRENRQARFLFTNRKALEAYPLASMRTAICSARDGQELVGYYTLPLESDPDQDGLPDHPLAMVFLPHGGPWGRDVWGFNAWHQWLANRGYAVLSVNFRSSTGFGKAFVNAGDKEWGGRVIQDQYDAVQWAIEKGIADPARVAIMGGSFGGYSTLAGLTFFPETYACGVDIVGPSNLVTLLETTPPYWKSFLETLTTRVGDFRTEEGRELLRRHSPLTYADRICRPLLVAQGANDPRVKQAEADQIVNALKEKGIPVTYLLYPDEGHGFARPENNLSFCAAAEVFLAKVLGGRCEPVGDDFQGSSIQVREQI